MVAAVAAGGTEVVTEVARAAAAWEAAGIVVAALVAERAVAAQTAVRAAAPAGTVPKADLEVRTGGAAGSVGLGPILREACTLRELL